MFVISRYTRTGRSLDLGFLTGRKDLPVSVTEYVEGHACRGKGCFRKLNAIFFEAVGTCHY